eukprot:CAMPEP_0183293138 /NCGR_PEP_ID=MMETSP0160_2-20130417/1940_1 /TAXON_ID=2839 ORGANISM="Odontella Sinensis, Strain Grunow 1884" /NCGR_SAMPLE_ID=MMETSP0160_2 /ASSEMBLY_ACC=CAM_ASM_000250 /LENGTH=163 /DNA_ID=CAMNT_0025454203 /DNA_START=55 /DNA_END=542 /DNA_ORIENTATION=+
MSSERSACSNEEALASLERLSAMLKDLDETGSKERGGEAADEQAASASASGHGHGCGRGLPLSHWRALSTDVAAAYRMIDDGSDRIRAASTKYTLVGKVDAAEGSKLSSDLLRGCELLGTGALVLHSPPAGCGRSARRYARAACRGAVSTVEALVRSFADGTA